MARSRLFAPVIGESKVESTKMSQGSARTERVATTSVV